MAERTDGQGTSSSPPLMRVSDTACYDLDINPCTFVLTINIKIGRAEMKSKRQGIGVLFFRDPHCSMRLMSSRKLQEFDRLMTEGVQVEEQCSGC